MATDNTFRFLKVDYSTHREALLQRVRTRWPGVWNDFFSSSLGTMLVDLTAWSTATVAFLINRSAGELYVPTMTLRESAVRIGALTGYQLRGATPATVACEATLFSALDADIVIKKGTAIRTSDATAVAFEVAEDYTILAGNLTPRVSVLRVSPLLAGSSVVSTYATVTLGSVYIDLADKTVDLTKHAEAGQSISVDGFSATYAVDSIGAQPGAVSNNRFILTTPWAGATKTTATLEVFDQRVLLIQGQALTDQFVVGTDDRSSFVVKLTHTSVLDQSVAVTVNGIPWSAVASLATSGPDAQVFQVKTLSSGQVLVQFGDDVFGASVPAEASLLVAYRIGGGTSGNIQLGTINTSITGLNQSTASPVAVSLTNLSSTGVGGRDAESLEEARASIPQHTRTNDRAVTLSDYQTLAMQYAHPQYGSVAYARASVRTENALLEGNIVAIYAWTTGASGGLASLSAPLKLALRDHLQTKAVGTDFVQIFDGVDKPAPISLRFKVLPGFGVRATLDLVRATVKAAVTALRPGQPLLFSNFVRSLDEVQGVDTLSLATPSDDLNPSTPVELFTAPSDLFVYNVSRNSAGASVTTSDDGATSLFVAQIPVFPVQAWSLRLFLGSNELAVLPSSRAGFAELFGVGVSRSTDLAANIPDSANSLDPDKSHGYKSTVNLLTGQTRLWLKGVPGALTMKLVTATGYSTEREISIYVGYTGDTSLAKRREIRSALRTWASGLAAGASLHGVEDDRILVSRSCVKNVVADIPGVDSVVRVALDSPAGTDSRISGVEATLLRVGTIVLNNATD